jgi:hypothetical protein
VFVFFGESEEVGRADDGHAWCVVDAEHAVDEVGFFWFVAADFDADEAVVVDFAHGGLDEVCLFGGGESCFQDEDAAVFDFVKDVREFFLRAEVGEGVFADEVERDFVRVLFCHRDLGFLRFLPNSLIIVV